MTLQGHPRSLIFAPIEKRVWDVLWSSYHIISCIRRYVSPFVAVLFSRSLESGRFPSGFKEAFITPVIKKSGLDITDSASYRPISNLSVLSKTRPRRRRLEAFTTDAKIIRLISRRVAIFPRQIFDGDCDAANRKRNFRGDTAEFPTLRVPR